MESSSHRQDKIAGAPCPINNVNWVQVSRRNSGTWTDNIESFQASFANDSVEVRIHHDQPGTRSPVAEKAGLDVVMGDGLLDKNVVIEEYHS